MIELSKKTNLLEQDPYKYELQDVPHPELYREIYSYEEVPKVPFNFRRVPINMPTDIWMTDTTFRDGQQSRAPYSVKQMVDLYQLMHRLGGPQGKIRQTEFFVYSPKDREALRQCMDLGYQFPECTTWIRAKEEDFKLVKDLGVKETGILVSCSDYHIFKKLQMKRSEALAHYLEVVRNCIEAGLRPRCHFEDITRADFYGFVVPFINALQDLSQESGVPIRIRACDTMGYGVPFTGASPPRSVAGIIYGIQHYSGVPSELIEWHGHNDFGLGVANATTAWLYGASGVNCSLLGIGERTGNIPLEQMVFQYISLRGEMGGMDTTAITDIADYYTKEIGYSIPPMQPFVGRDFNVTRAGIHADGLMKDPEIYNIFDTDKFLDRPAGVAVSATSGLAGIAYWINSYFRLSEEKQVSKHDPLVQQIKDAVDGFYTDGRQTVISDEEMTELIERFAPNRFENPYFAKKK